MKRLAAAAALFLAPTLAVASTIVGNPTSSVLIVDGSDVYVHSVIAYKCTSGVETISVGATLDQWESADLDVPVGSYCTVVALIRKTPQASVEPYVVGGFDELSISTSAPEVTVEFDASTGTATLN